MWTVLGVSWPQLSGRNWGEFHNKAKYSFSLCTSGNSVQVTALFIEVRISAGNEGALYIMF